MNGLGPAAAPTPAVASVVPAPAAGLAITSLEGGFADLLRPVAVNESDPALSTPAGTTSAEVCAVAETARANGGAAVPAVKGPARPETTDPVVLDQQLVSLLLHCEAGEEQPQPVAEARVERTAGIPEESAAAMPALQMPFVEIPVVPPAPLSAAPGNSLPGAADADPSATRGMASVQLPVSAAPGGTDSPRPAEIVAGPGVSPSDTILAADATPSNSFNLAPVVPPSAPPSPVTPTPLSAPVDVRREDWPQQLGERIHWQLGAGVQEARIELAPEGLGPLELRVQVEAGQVQLHIGAAHAVTRELLNEALPRLRELLGDSGLSLGQASVSSQQERPSPPIPTRHVLPFAEPEAAEVRITPVRRLSRGLLDHYA